MKFLPFLIPQTLTIPCDNWSTNINGQCYEFGFGSKIGNLYVNG